MAAPGNEMEALRLHYVSEINFNRIRDYLLEATDHLVSGMAHTWDSPDFPHYRNLLAEVLHTLNMLMLYYNPNEPPHLIAQ